jgi:RNA polymerase sigma-70 factor (ECF subfamily)
MRQQLDRLRAALARLEGDDRAVIVARDLEGLSGRETAELLDISLAAMKARLHRARLRLVAELRTEAGETDGACTEAGETDGA